VNEASLVNRHNLAVLIRLQCVPSAHQIPNDVRQYLRSRQVKVEVNCRIGLGMSSQQYTAPHCQSGWRHSNRRRVGEMETLHWADISAALSDLESESVLRFYQDGDSTNAWCLEEVVQAYAYTYKGTASLVYNSSPLHSRSQCRSRSLPLTGSSLASRSLMRLDSLPRFHSLSSKFRTPTTELQPNFAIRSTLCSTISMRDGFVDVELDGE